MTTTGIRASGEFCWINMLTPQPAEARAFFSKILGWTYGEIPGVGHIIKVDGHDVGGLFDLNGPNTPPGTPPLIGVMIKVDNADATAEKVRSLGGKAQLPGDIMGNLRMSVCHDPNGAQFDLWQSIGKQGTDVDIKAHGAPSWSENMATDAAVAIKFYSDLFGWTTETMQMPDGMAYTLFKHRGESVAGLFQIMPDMGKMPANWGTYFTVKNVDDAVRESLALGAKICMPMKEAPGVGRFSGITSPQGVNFYLIQYTN